MGDQETTEIVREDEKYETESERACRSKKMDQGGIRKTLVADKTHKERLMRK